MPEPLHALDALRDLLERSHYRSVVHTLTNGRVHQTPWARAPRARVARLPVRLATVLRLFHVGEAVEGAEDTLGASLVDPLVEIGLLQPTRSGLSLGPYTILPYERLLLIAQRWEPGQETAADHLWLGTD